MGAFSATRFWSGVWFPAACCGGACCAGRFAPGLPGTLGTRGPGARPSTPLVFGMNGVLDLGFERISAAGAPVGVGKRRRLRVRALGPRGVEDDGNRRVVPGLGLEHREEVALRASEVRREEDQHQHQRNVEEQRNQDAALDRPLADDVLLEAGELRDRAVERQMTEAVLLGRRRRGRAVEREHRGRARAALLFGFGREGAGFVGEPAEHAADGRLLVGDRNGLLQEPRRGRIRLGRPGEAGEHAEHAPSRGAVVAGVRRALGRGGGGRGFVLHDPAEKTPTPPRADRARSSCARTEGPAPPGPARPFLEGP